MIHDLRKQKRFKSRASVYVYQSFRAIDSGVKLFHDMNTECAFADGGGDNAIMGMSVF